MIKKSQDERKTTNGGNFRDGDKTKNSQNRL